MRKENILGLVLGNNRLLCNMFMDDFHACNTLSSNSWQEETE